MTSFPTAAKLTVIAVAIVGATGVTARHAAAAASVAVVPQSAGDPVAGRTLYQACTGCHSLDENDVGPRHRGVVGRKAGTVPGYAYSAVLRTSGMVWTPANLDRWLTNPQKVVPGAKMYFSVANPKQRADIIAYLAQQR
ncbi:MAG: c-type cytochrome [Pseudomonadota bacterium]|jgi:cytochrome c